MCEDSPRVAVVLRRTLTRRLLTAWLVLLALSLHGCVFFGGDEAFEFPILVTEDFTVTVDIGAVTGSVAGQTAPETTSFDVDLPAIPVDIVSLSSEVADNRNKIRTIAIERIEVTPNPNTVTTGSNLPSIDLSIGPLNGGGNTFDVATIPPIPGGSTETVLANIDTTEMEAAQVYISTLAFSFQPGAVLEVQQGQIIPGGSATLTLNITIRAIVDPTR